jgi:hypothetical protein
MRGHNNDATTPLSSSRCARLLFVTKSMILPSNAAFFHKETSESNEGGGTGKGDGRKSIVQGADVSLG